MRFGYFVVPAKFAGFTPDIGFADPREAGQGVAVGFFMRAHRCGQTRLGKQGGIGRVGGL